MLDHAGFPVSDYKRSKAFYEKALAPLGYVLVMEVQQDQNDAPAAGFGANGKPNFWIGGEGGLNKPSTSRSRRGIARQWMHSTARQSQPAARITARRDCARIITQTTTVRSYSTPTAIISKRCATHRRKPDL